MKKTSHACGWIAACLFLFTAINSRATGYTLTVAAQGSGTVIRNPANSSYPAGATLTITATPDAGWYFSNWSGDTNGSVNPLNVVMNSSLNITGNFLAYPTYALTLTTNGQGTIGLSPAGGSYQSNTLVTATATPSAGWVFAGWSGATNNSTSPLSLTVNANTSLAGTFAQLPAFDVQPSSVTNAVGGNVSFSSHAVGSAPLNYQWYFSGGLLGGATNATLALTNIAIPQASNYQVIATNNYGSATSSVVLLVLTNVSRAPNVVYSAEEASLRAALKLGGWVGLGFNGTITITKTIAITNNVILDGGNFATTISGGNAVRLFTVAPGVSFSATNVTFANGACLVTNGTTGTPADAGAIYNNGGTVTLTSCTLTNNTAQSLIFGGLARGGAIFNNGGTVSLSQSAVVANSAIGGGAYNANSSGPTNIALGGAIFNSNGTVIISNCNVNGNSSSSVIPSNSSQPGTGLAMGGAVFQTSGSLFAVNSVFSTNRATGGQGSGTAGQPASPAQGGALAVTAGSATMNGVRFSANTATGGNSGYHAAAGPAFGGAIYSAATLTVADCTFSGNQALAGNFTIIPQGGSKGVDGAGGAIYNAATATLNRCTLYSNSAQGGYATPYLFTLTLGGSGLGGGIFNAAQCAVTNCTIALNLAVGGDGEGNSAAFGTNGSAIGGGFFNAPAAVASFMNSTLASNFCTVVSGSYDSTNGLTVGTQIANSNGTFHVHNSLIAYGGTNSNAYGSFSDDGYNISSDGSTAFASGSSYNFTDPKLGPLADNGGPTLTMAPLANSPAIDFGDANGAPHSDQRGLLRPVGDGYDIGAVEYGSVYPAPSAVMILFTHSAPNWFLNFSATPSIVYHLQSSTNLTSWTDMETIGAFTSPSNITRTVTPQAGGKKFYRVWYQ